MILATCGLEEYRKLDGRVTCEGERVLFNLELSVAEFLENKNVLDDTGVWCVTVVGWGGIEKLPDLVSEKWRGRVYVLGRLDDIEMAKNLSDGYIFYIKLDSRYSNMRELYDMCGKYSNVRFTGGKLLLIDGVRIGRTDEGKDKINVYMEESYDNFLEVNYSDLNDVAVIRSKLKKSDSQSSEKKQKSKSVPKPNVIAGSFSSLFGGEDVDF